MSTTTTDRPIDRTYRNVLAHWADIVALSKLDGEDVPADLLGRLDLEDAPQYPGDTAQELADSSVYSVERLGLIDGEGQCEEIRSVELLLGGGGPTITLTATLRDGDTVRDFTLWHSWGAATGDEASLRGQCAADVDTVDAFLNVLGVLGL